jgi:acyl-coenzyme A synthetase/AMP-(fatty) acid ligase/aryl carrier-like protein
VAVTHAGIMHAVTAQAALGVTEQDRIWQFASASFDASVYEVWLALTNGATLVLRAPGSMPEGGVAASLEAAQITVTLLPPTLLAVTGAVASRSVRLVMVGGEACPPTVWSAWARERALWNLYGPTEATVVATAWAGPTPNDGTAPPIGRPIANARTYVLDADGRPVPVGVPGELYIGGGGVARGYWRRPAATAAAFVPDPFSDSPGARLYRTGDRVRWRPDGALDFLERNDRQVKLHGIRIELGEIEAVIRRHAAVRACVVELRTIHGDARLVAYVVADGLQSTAALRQALSAWLPPALIPSAFVFMDALPLTPNGKIDRAALPLPDLERPAADTPSLPDGSIERAIADVWRSVLHVSDVPTDENFFDAGGDSLSLLKVYTQLKTVFDGVQVVDLFQHPTITSLAAALAENQSASASA